MDVTVIEGCSIVTMDPDATEIDDGHVIVGGGRILAIGRGPAPNDAYAVGSRRVDGRGCLLTPGLVNTHHHLYQWATRGLAADDGLFGWLTTSYPIWRHLDEDIVRGAATTALGQLALTGCTTSSDHHYVFPHDGGDVLGATIDAAATIGLRFHATRGSMDLGRSQGGLPPDEVTEDRDVILAASADAMARWHDPSPSSMVQIALAPCSPFSVTGALLRESATLARELGVRLHTHLAETADEEAFCLERFGARPVDYLADLGWVEGDVWFGHGIHLSDADITAFASVGAGVAHCPSSNARLGAGIARLRDLTRAGVPVGLGVDGAASNESSSLVEELRHALLFSRAKDGPEALTVREALAVATLGGARVLGRADDIGSIEVGKQADLALWRLDALSHHGIDDPVAALVLGSAPPLEALLVGGRLVVEGDRLVTADQDELATEAQRVTRRLREKSTT